MREHIHPNYTNMWTIPTHPQHTPTHTNRNPTPCHPLAFQPSYTHARPLFAGDDSLCWELHAFPITTDRLTDCLNTLKKKKNGRFYSVVIRESRKEEEKTKQNTRISVQKNRRKTVSFHVKPQWLFYYTQGHSETASFTSNHNTVETKERKSYECLNMRNSCFLDYYCLTALPKMFLAKRQTKRKAQSKNDPNAIHILYDECLSCQS